MNPQRRSAQLPPNTSARRRHRPDYLVVILSVILLVAGLIVVYAISPALTSLKNVGENYFIIKQSLAIAIGVAAFWLCSVVPLETWRRIQKPLIGLAVAATLAVLVFGEKVNGAYRWIQIGGLSFQAVELIKFTLVICLACFLADRLREGKISDWQRSIRPIVIIAGIIGVVVAVLQSDLGSAGVLMAMIVAMCFVAGVPLQRLAIIGGILAIGAVLAISTSAYRRERLLTFMQPERDCVSTGYQACQALIAVGSGGMFGKGLAHSVQAYGYLPEAANDSIFAIIAEKFGFVGVTLLLGLFMALFGRLKHLMERAPDDFTRLVLAGILAWLSTQALINVGAMIGLLPLKGITLPFISYGGTSIIFVMAAMGLVFNISRYTNFSVRAPEGNRHDDSRQRRGDRRTYYAPLGRRS